MKDNNVEVVVDTVIKDEELDELNKEADLYVQKLNSEQNTDLSKVLSTRRFGIKNNNEDKRYQH